MADVYAKHRSAGFEEISKIANDEFSKLTPDEKVVYDAIVNEDVLGTTPENFFNEMSVDELNEHFGAHDNVVVTENLRAALDSARVLIKWFDDMAEQFPSLPEK